ncbi:hypothetical protein HAX54_015883, partial [Datura stramonium]|nr:hypothetical protein [Datura stramonium]
RIKCEGITNIYDSLRLRFVLLYVKFSNQTLCEKCLETWLGVIILSLPVVSKDPMDKSGGVIKVQS